MTCLTGRNNHAQHPLDWRGESGSVNDMSAYDYSNIRLLLRVSIVLGLGTGTLCTSANPDFVVANAARKTTGELTLTWNSRTNTQYNLQWSADLRTNHWRSLAGLTAGNGSTNSLPDSSAQPQRFYRVVTVQKIVPVTEADSGGTVQLGPGDILQVVFTENASTGYTWELIAGTAEVVALIGDPKHQPGSGIGGSGTVTYQFEPIAAGQTSLKFIYHRTFEPNVPPAKTVDLTVVVVR